MAVFPGEQRSPAGSTNRVADEAVPEDYTLIRNPVKVGSPVDLTSLGANRLVSMIIGHDIDNIGPQWLRPGA